MLFFIPWRVTTIFVGFFLLLIVGLHSYFLVCIIIVTGCQQLFIISCATGYGHMTNLSANPVATNCKLGKEVKYFLNM